MVEGGQVDLKTADQGVRPRIHVLCFQVLLDGGRLLYGDVYAMTPTAEMAAESVYLRDEVDSPDGGRVCVRDNVDG